MKGALRTIVYFLFIENLSKLNYLIIFNKDFVLYSISYSISSIIFVIVKQCDYSMPR